MANSVSKAGSRVGVAGSVGVAEAGGVLVSVGAIVSTRVVGSTFWQAARLNNNIVMNSFNPAGWYPETFWKVLAELSMSIQERSHDSHSAPRGGTDGWHGIGGKGRPWSRRDCWGRRDVPAQGGGGGAGRWNHRRGGDHHFGRVNLQHC